MNLVKNVDLQNTGQSGIVKSDTILTRREDNYEYVTAHLLRTLLCQLY